MSDSISRQSAISAICNACGKIDCDKMDKCEKLQLPPANSSEFPNNSDTISRQAAIDAIESAFDRETILNRFVRKIAISAVRLLPSAQPEPHWVPCGERLPEEKQSVLVTDGSVIWVCDIISTDEGYKWEDSHGYWLDLDEWTAWMPLPKPYRGGDE